MYEKYTPVKTESIEAAAEHPHDEQKSQFLTNWLSELDTLITNTPELLEDLQSEAVETYTGDTLPRETYVFESSDIVGYLWYRLEDELADKSFPSEGLTDILTLVSRMYAHETGRTTTVCFWTPTVYELRRAGLSNQQSLIYVMRYQYGLTPTEIATELEINRSNVYIQTSRISEKYEKASTIVSVLSDDDFVGSSDRIDETDDSPEDENSLDEFF
jgi:predicted DNA-binding protein YlxM (UPF0122 family)